MGKKIDKKEIAQQLVSASYKLSGVAASAAFEFWSRDDFRIHVAFKNISQTEQDRIFNELEVSILGLFELHLQYAQSVSKKEYQLILKEFRENIVEGFLKILSDAKVDQLYLDQWRKLIEMRFEEYKKDLKIALKTASKMENFDKDDQLRNTWARVETITIAAMSHIRRGNIDPKDPLWDLLRKWIISVDAVVGPITSLSQDIKPHQN